MKKKLNKKKSSHGFSLIELILAMLISSIIMVMLGSIISNSFGSFTKENMKANVQNRCQNIITSLQDSLMEAKYIDATSAGKIDTSKPDTNGVFADVTGRSIRYDSTKDVLYMSKRSFEKLSVDEQKGAILARYVTDFSVELDPSCKFTDSIGTVYLVNPVKLNVTIEVTQRGRSSKYTQTIALRNRISEVTFDGDTYVVENKVRE